MTAPGDPPPPARQYSLRGDPLRWCFAHRDTGRITIAQWPNLPAWLFIAGSLAQLVLHPAGRLGLALTIVTVAALAWWALEEVILGANPWRRLLGVLAFVYLAWRFWPR